jgi:hypothetical protein
MFLDEFVEHAWLPQHHLRELDLRERRRVEADPSPAPVPTWMSLEKLV